MSEFEFAINSAKQIAKELQERQMNRPDQYQERVWDDGKQFGLRNNLSVDLQTNHYLPITSITFDYVAHGCLIFPVLIRETWLPLQALCKIET